MNRRTVPDSLTQLAVLLRRFASGEDRSVSAARQIEGLIALDFPAEHPIQELADFLAQYRPGGGEYLYGEAEALPQVCRWLDQIEGASLTSR